MLIPYEILTTPIHFIQKFTFYTKVLEFYDDIFLNLIQLQNGDFFKKNSLLFLYLLVNNLL